MIAIVLAFVWQQFMPLTPVSDYRWPAAGVAVPGAFRDDLPVLYRADGSGPPIWFADWWLGCELYSENGLPYGQGLYRASYVPMVRRAWDPFALRCNDGRPLLVGNEPELAGQDNMTPAAMASLLHTAIAQWRGPVWCCGVLVQHTGYMAQVIAEYRRLYGAWPPSVGVHVHLYVMGPDGSPVISSLSDEDVTRAQAALDAFLALLADNGLLARRVVISECCVLSNILTPAQVWSAARRMLDYAGDNPAVATVGWYALRSRGAGLDEFAASDLVTGGEINALGTAWLDYAAGGRVLRGD